MNVYKVTRNKKKSKLEKRGRRLAIPAGQVAKYKRKLKALTERMIKTTKRMIMQLFESSTSEEFYEKQMELVMTMDTASIASKARKLTNMLTKKFTQLFAYHAKDYSEDMVKGAAKASKDSLNASLKKVDEDYTLKGKFLPSNVKEVSKASISENVALIKSIPQEYMQKVNGSVMRAITNGGDLEELTKTLEPGLTKYGDQAKRRSKNIAEDQVRKAYNNVNMQRMLAIGVTKFEWVHSGGGQHPRKLHQEYDGRIFSFDDLPIIEEGTTQRGIPGQAPNCGCTMIPIFDFEDEGNE